MSTPLLAMLPGNKTFGDGLAGRRASARWSCFWPSASWRGPRAATISPPRQHGGPTCSERWVIGERRQETLFRQACDHALLRSDSIAMVSGRIGRGFGDHRAWAGILQHQVRAMRRVPLEMHPQLAVEPGRRSARPLLRGMEQDRRSAVPIMTIGLRDWVHRF
jgi:hypothetical protein